MGCRIIEGKECGTNRTKAVFFDSVTDTSFGPVMDDADEAEDFLKSIDKATGFRDPREYTDIQLRKMYDDWKGAYDSVIGDDIVATESDEEVTPLVFPKNEP